MKIGPFIAIVILAMLIAWLYLIFQTITGLRYGIKGESQVGMWTPLAIRQDSKLNNNLYNFLILIPILMP
jgi:hypothetical protein